MTGYLTLLGLLPHTVRRECAVSPHIDDQLFKHVVVGENGYPSAIPTCVT